MPQKILIKITGEKYIFSHQDFNLMESEYNFNEHFKRCDPLDKQFLKFGKSKDIKENDDFLKTTDKLKKLTELILYLKNKRISIEKEFPMEIQNEYFEIALLIFYYRKRICRAIELYEKLFSSLKKNFNPHCLVILEGLIH